MKTLKKDDALETRDRHLLTPMQWIETLRRLSGLSLRAFARDCKTSHSQLTQRVHKDSPAVNKWMRTLCLMRRASGLTGNQIFKLWDKIYLDDETKPKP